ncbi:MAG TPA: hypothetical protein VII50_11230 [Acidothermaceae bacterium]
MAETQSSAQPNPSAPFNAWQRATAAFREAEHRGAAHADIVRLAEQVIRARNALVLDRLEAGWQPRDDVLHHLICDEDLLHEKDDSGYHDIAASTTQARPAVVPAPPS